MSIKDLFNKGYSLKFLKSKNQDNLREDLESNRFIEAYSKRSQRFFPDVDFTTASNFARFGLAEEYYDTAIKRIYQTYPYDGSAAERIEWENESTYLDLFIFENEYPRTNGFVTVNSASHTYTSTRQNNIYSSSLPQYISFKGAPKVDPRGDYKSPLGAGTARSGISKANIYDTGSQRTSNLEFDLEKGVTVECWMKKDAWAGQTPNAWEVIFSNITTGSVASDNYMIMYVADSSKSTVYVEINSGSVNHTFSHNTGLTDIADGLWHHYALTAKKTSTGTKTELFVDGTHISEIDTNKSFTAFDNTLVGAIGALAAPIKLGPGKVQLTRAGWGNIVRTSFDEFRYWKTERNAKQIGRFWRDQIAGGTNTDNIKYDDITNKVDLGIYYKFNEGIAAIPSTDSIILDYSGRISNGIYENYSAANSRSTESAMVLAGAATKEFKDPILYATHPAVASLIVNKKKLGKMHDYSNAASLYKSLPGWIAEEDEKESNHLKYLTQIMASFLDDLYLQIKKIPELKNINYPDDNLYEKPLPFADRLLETRGYDAPELFSHASALAQFLQRDEKILFEKKLQEIKNIIYQNIYNNLSYIQKSKGTFKSLRNFLRCFGVDEELIKLNLYANNDEYEFKDNFTNTALSKKYVDFDDLETRFKSNGNYNNSFTATAYQFKYASVNNSISYIPAITETQMSGAALTIEAEIIFPKRKLAVDTNFEVFPSLTSSLFGLHAVPASDTNIAFASDDTINFNIVALKNSVNEKDASIALITSGSSNILSDLKSTLYTSIYDNQKWNLAFRLRPKNISVPNFVDGAVGNLNSGYIYELYGNNFLSNELQNEFIITGSLNTAQAAKFFTNPKRIFIGSARKHFTGSVELYSDVKISSVRAWYNYIDNETMRFHGKNSKTYGAKDPFKSSDLNYQNSNIKIPEIKTLFLNWTIDNVTGSDANGQFLINDFSSGSNSTTDYGYISSLINKNYTGRGDFFTSGAAFREEAVDVEFVQTAKQKLPEVVNSDDMIKILNKQDDVVFTRDTTYVQHLLSVEKSMYQIISEEMLRFFASITSFNNLIGEPVNRYRPRYKTLEKLKQLFFERVETGIDLEKFIEFYKWIDDAVTMMIGQLIPASANTVELLRNMVESHILERNKYFTKFPTLELSDKNIIGSAKAIDELKYNWKFGHAPLNQNQNSNQNTNCLWWKERAERDDALSSGVTAVDNDKNTILKVYNTDTSGAFLPVLKTQAGEKYLKSYYHDRSLTKLHDLVSDRSLKLKSGANSQQQNRHDFYKGIIKWGSDDDFIYIDADNELPKVDCNDKHIPDEINKKRFLSTVLTMPATELSGSNSLGTGIADKKPTDGKSTLLLPFSMYSSSISTGYRSSYVGGTMPKIEFANIHEDKYGLDAEIPMQGPFTEKYVGGMQHRHIKLNQGSDNDLNRAEGWHIEPFLDLSADKDILDQTFDTATTTPSEDTHFLPLPAGSATGDPSPFEYWKNGVGADNQWSFISGPTPSAGTGPSGGSFGSNGYAYCEVLPSRVGQTFSLVSPLIDFLDISAESRILFTFLYHMHGVHIGNLVVQASEDSSFTTGVKNLNVRWYDSSGLNFTTSNVISGQQQTSPTEAFRVAAAGVNMSSPAALGPDDGLNSFIGKRFYIRFLYTAGISHLGDLAIDRVRIYKAGTTTESLYGDVFQNSFKLLHPTYDDHNRPYATLSRDNLAKSPINIKNIHMTGSSPTVAGNFLNRYEYINTVSPEANDPFFVKNIGSITQTHPEIPLINKIETILLTPASETTGRTSLSAFRNFTLPDRSFISGSTIKNRTRIMSRFSSPGGFETTTRGFLDPAHETYSVYNALNYKNLSPRIVFNTQLQAHCGQFGASTHGTGSTSARIFGNTLLEKTGTINALDYQLAGDAAKHKYHRNNIERLKLTGASSDFSKMTAITASSFDNAFVSHMIPRTDKQTRWITASLI